MEILLGDQNNECLETKADLLASAPRKSIGREGVHFFYRPGYRICRRGGRGGGLRGWEGWLIHRGFIHEAWNPVVIQTKGISVAT